MRALFLLAFLSPDVGVALPAVYPSRDSLSSPSRIPPSILSGLPGGETFGDPIKDLMRGDLGSTLIVP